jgi:glycine cleavage system transcriptional repressor
VRELAVTAIGADRPGIIARVTGVLLDHGGNLEDSSMTILSGQFAIMLLVRSEADPATLERALTDATADLGLVVTVREVGDGVRTAPSTHMLSLYGADRPGLVHAAATVLADHQVNVTDLTTRVLEGERPVYAMLFEIAVPEGTDPDSLVRALQGADGLDQVEASVHALETETF